VVLITLLQRCMRFGDKMKRVKVIEHTVYRLRRWYKQEKSLSLKSRINKEISRLNKLL
jgi:hypothetical protein